MTAPTTDPFPPANAGTNTTTAVSDDTAGVVARPPLIYLAGLLVGLGIDALWPAPLLPAPWQYGIGGALVALGIAIVLAAGAGFARAGTNVPTNRPSTALVTTGLYRFSRNPIYIGLTALHLGIAALVDSPWMAAMVVPVLLVLRYGVIAREERYLERRFGDAYRGYTAAVRRWI